MWTLNLLGSFLHGKQTVQEMWEYYNNDPCTLIRTRVVSILVNQDTGKFKDKLKFQNAVTLKRTKKETTSHSSMIHHLLNHTATEDGNVNSLHWFERNDPLVTHPVWPNKLHQSITCYWIWNLALFPFVLTKNILINLYNVLLTVHHT